MSYRCEVKSVTGFVQQIACCWLRHGYWWYVTGEIPDHKCVNSVDEKLIERYDIDVSEWRRARNKQLGRANIQYLRHDRFFVLLSTKGEHPFYQLEAGRFAVSANNRSATPVIPSATAPAGVRERAKKILAGTLMCRLIAGNTST